MPSIKSILVSGVLGASLLLTGCSAGQIPGLPGTKAAEPSVAKPMAKEGLPIEVITYPEIQISEEYLIESAVEPSLAQDAAKLGFDTLKIFTTEYAKHQKKSETLNQEELLALLPDAESKLSDKLNPDALQKFSEKWKEGASNPADLSNGAFMLATDSEGETEADNKWKNTANLQCGLSDTEWTSTFSMPRLEYVPVEGLDYKVTAFKATAHYLVPCSEGKVISQNMEWTFLLGPSADNSKWEVYQWERKPLAEPAYAE